LRQGDVQKIISVVIFPHCAAQTKKKRAKKDLHGRIFVLPCVYFGDSQQDAADMEGWNLWDCDGQVEICINDEQGSHLSTDAEVTEYLKTHIQLDNDQQALNLIVEKAAAGSKMHLLALYLDGRQSNETVDIPLSLQVKKGSGR
jgi:hypothetical protein